VTVLVEADGNEPLLEHLKHYRDVGGQTPVGEGLDDDCISASQLRARRDEEMEDVQLPIGWTASADSFSLSVCNIIDTSAGKHLLARAWITSATRRVSCELKGMRRWRTYTLRLGGPQVQTAPP
jgi:hypothetical protein